MSFGHLFSQELRPMPLDLDALTSKAIDFNFEEDMATDTFSVMQISDLYTLQLLSFLFTDRPKMEIVLKSPE